MVDYNFFRFKIKLEIRNFTFFGVNQNLAEKQRNGIKTKFSLSRFLTTISLVNSDKGSFK
jgi:hypothetical protein